ncbi:ATP-binding domain-containing protein [Geobacter sulfurreducens]|uniref:ATP-binding domain-containing protein n=1 Tax=Geobacter sulfurreducens TaxID=35554 RepID=UPI0001D8F274|nr:ATP-binding domain-containing protein [Geobacter sulfurreducens]ADI84190.1 NERD and DEXDc domain protein [Geobacter sulfurreducens KN400]
MAKMIPPYLSADCKSPGEKLLFDRFRTDPATDDWIVLHSLGIAKHPERLSGEIDFVVVVPGLGVLCLEVKAGNVRRYDGFWICGSGINQEKSSVGPFRQASDGMHAIKKYLSRTDQSLSRILIYSGVIFTYINFDEESPEWHKWQHADRSRIYSTPISEVCSRMLRCAHEHVRSTPSSFWYDAKASRPDKEQSLQITNILRGDFECVFPLRAAIDQTEKQIIVFTEEQFAALDTLDVNNRLVFRGPAGTGKTFLAVEAARRSVLSGKKTLLICFNRMLGQWLNQATKSFRDQNSGMLTAGTLHSVMRSMIKTENAADYSQNYWNKQLPSLVIESILEESLDVPQFDMLIVDEAQDIIKEEFMDVLDLMLTGGLSGGKWAFFGDFERQAIYTQFSAGTHSIDCMEILRARSPFHFVYPLRINCRNTLNISVGIEVACLLDPRYSKVLHAESGSDIDIEFYSTAEEQQHKLLKQLSSLRNTFSNNEIVILSPKENTVSCAEQLSAADTHAYLSPFHTDIPKTVTGYATIQAFKGLEAPAVILTDIEELEGYYAQALLYIGMSRARIHLVLIMHEKCRKKYLEINEQGLKIILGGQSGKS